MTAFYHVTVRWVKTEVDPKKVEPLFDAVGNWARLSAYSWYVWSDLTSNQIYNGIRGNFHVEDSIVVLAVNPEDRAGWAPNWFWKWVETRGASGPNG